MQGHRPRKRRFGLGTALVAFALILLETSYITRDQGQTDVGDIRRSVQRPDGSWTLDDSLVIERPDFGSGPRAVPIRPTSLPSLYIRFYIRHQYGWGWERWVAEGKNYPGGPPLTPAQLNAAEHAAWVGLAKDPPYPELLPAFEMLRDGIATRTVGVAYYLRIIALWLGLALIAAAGVLLLVRFGRVQRAKVRIGRIDLGLCGRCKYPITRRADGPGRCSECGADIEADLALARSVVDGGVGGGGGSGLVVADGPQPPAHP